MKKFKLTIRLSGGVLQTVYIVADSSYNANKMAEAQYGKGSITMSATYVSMA